MSIDDEIQLAQRALELRRQKLEIEPATPEQAQVSAAWHHHHRGRKAETLADILARVPMTATAEPEESPEDRAYRLAESRLDAGIPDAFRGVTWRKLAGLMGPEGQTALGGVKDSTGRVLVGEAAVGELRARIEAPKVVLLGETRAGKSVSLAAAIDGALREGAERARWCSSINLRDPGAIERAAGAKRLFLDDIGEELFGAAAGTGLCSQRNAPVCELFGKLERLRGKQSVVTTSFPFATMAALYGANVAARVYEGAAVIHIVRLGGG